MCNIYNNASIYIRQYSRYYVQKVNIKQFYNKYNFQLEAKLKILAMELYVSSIPSGLKKKKKNH